MFWFKSCPRCIRGDMTLDEDGDKICLHCGHVQYSVTAPAFVAGFENLVDASERSTKSAPVDTARRDVILAV